MTWLEALPPLIIITGAIGLMGSLQGVAHRAFHGGKDKRIQRDYFDFLMDKRDERIRKSGKEIYPDIGKSQS